MARKQNPDNPMPDRVKQDGRGTVRSKAYAFSLYEGDVQIVLRLADHYGCNKSEVVRTALRHLEAVVTDG